MRGRLAAGFAATALAAAGVAAGPPPPSAELLSDVDALPPLLAKLGADGRPVVVHFWATWCDACVAELPVLAKALEAARAKAAAVALVSLDPPALRSSKVPELLGKFGISPPGWVLDAPAPAPVTKLFDPAWQAELPATFVLVAGKLRLSLLKPLERASQLTDAFDAPALRPDRPGARRPSGARGR